MLVVMAGHCRGCGDGLGACAAVNCLTWACTLRSCSKMSWRASATLLGWGTGLTACRPTPRWGSARTPEEPPRARCWDSGWLPARHPGRRSFAPDWPSLPGVPLTRLFMLMGLNGACDAARAPCRLAGVSAWLGLTLGARFPERFWPLGPGFFASPIRSPSFQLWLCCSGWRLLLELDATGVGEAGGLAWAVWEAASSAAHWSNSCRTPELTMRRIRRRSSGHQSPHSALRISRSLGFSMKAS